MDWIFSEWLFHVVSETQREQISFIRENLALLAL